MLDWFRGPGLVGKKSMGNAENLRVSKNYSSFSISAVDVNRIEERDDCLYLPCNLFERRVLSGGR